MTKFLMLHIVFVVCILKAHCAIYKYSDENIYRAVRSPHYGGYLYAGRPLSGPPPPPAPTPFIYHTHNWSGVARGAGGAAQGVFSGAAASAGSAGPGNEALALADASSGKSENCDDDIIIDGPSESSQYSKSTQFSDNYYGSSSAGHAGQIKSTGSQSHGGKLGNFESASGYATHSVGSGLGEGVAGGSGSGSAGFGSQSGQYEVRGSDNSGSGGFGSHSGQYKVDSKKFASSSNSNGFSGARQHSNGIGQQNHGARGQTLDVHSGYTRDSDGFQESQNFEEGKHFLNSGASNQGGFDGNQQTNLKLFSSSHTQSSSASNEGNLGPGPQQTGFLKPTGGFKANNQAATASQSQFSGLQKKTSSDFAYVQHGTGSQSNNNESQDTFGQAELNSGIPNGGQAEISAVSAGSASRGDAHAAFSGALDLASQTLQAANKAGCSTCQKSNYALSNAKSYNGNAISLAIGG